MAEQRTVLDKGFLALDGVFASDLAVVNAARVSFNTHEDELDDAGRGLVRFLMRERHGTPFEHGVFRFLVKAPIFVAREWMRHRIGSYNEWSGRYSKIEPEFYIPKHPRTQVGKPGSYSFEPLDYGSINGFQTRLRWSYEYAFETYEALLKKGVAKEQARMVLPLATYTKFYWTVNPRALMNFLSLRNTNQAQWEIRQYAIQAEAFFANHMPTTAAAFVENGRVCP